MIFHILILIKAIQAKQRLRKYIQENIENKKEFMQPSCALHHLISACGHDNDLSIEGNCGSKLCPIKNII